MERTSHSTIGSTLLDQPADRQVCITTGIGIVAMGRRAQGKGIEEGNMAGLGIDADGAPPRETETAQPVAWLASIALLSTAIFPVLALYGFGVALPVIAKAFAAEPGAVLVSQLIGSIVGLAFALGSPIVGTLIDRLGYRRVLTLSSIAFAVIGGAGGLVDNLYLILATRVLLGFTVAGTLVSGLTGIGLLNHAQRVRLYGMQTFVGGALAMAVYPAVGALASLGWRWPFSLHVVGLILLPLYAVLPKHTARTVEPKDEADLPAPKLPASLLLIAMFMGMAGIVGPIFSPFFLGSIGITSPAEQSLPLTTMGATALVASALFSTINRRLGVRWTFALAIAVGAAGNMLAGSVDSVAMMCVAMAGSAIGASLFSPNLSAAVAQIAGKAKGRALGLASAAMYGAQAIFPFIAELIMHFAGPAEVFRLFAVAGFALALGFVVTARRGAVLMPAGKAG
jgi:MFS family permease